jgi:glycogen synthase
VRILVERGDKNFQVDVYGGGLAPQFIQRVHAEGLSAYINYIGLVERDEMVRRFARYDALVFPTWQREPLGLVPFEAAAQGCIPIVTAQTGACEWLTDQESIKIERSGFGLAGGMQRVMHMGAEERAAMQARVCRNVRRYFGASRWFPRIERVISEPLEAAPAMTPRMARDAIFTITRAWNP